MFCNLLTYAKLTISIKKTLAFVILWDIILVFFYYICHAFCAILFGIEIFIDTYMEQKKRPVNRTYFKITIPHPSVLKGYYGGIGFIFYGIMVILYYMI